VRRFYFSGVLVHRAPRAQVEHHQMLDYLRRKDLPSLEAVVRAHNQTALDAYTAYLDAASVPASAAARRA
jgi:DNA-binding GntR family transcriptional regulator